MKQFIAKHRDQIRGVLSKCFMRRMDRAGMNHARKDNCFRCVRDWAGDQDIVEAGGASEPAAGAGLAAAVPLRDDPARKHRRAALPGAAGDLAGRSAEVVSGRSDERFEASVRGSAH